MNVQLAIQLITAAAQLSKTLAPMVEDLIDTVGSEDKQKLKTALMELQEANGIIYARTQTKLRGPPR